MKTAKGRRKSDHAANLSQFRITCGAPPADTPPVATYGTGNTSVRLNKMDQGACELRALWVRGSDSDRATIGAEQLTGLRLEQIGPLRKV